MLKTENVKSMILLMLVAYAFSFGIRMIWVIQMEDVGHLYWNGQLMINTNDGYYFASGAKAYLEGVLQNNPRVPGLMHTAVITLTAMLTKLTPFSLETVMLYLPAIVASFVVIPIILIGRLLGSTYVGFWGALVGSVAWSYYNRTMVGYLDTDMFSVMAPMFILYFLLAMIKTERLVFAVMGAVAFMIYPYLYDQGRAVVYAMGIIYMVYMVWFHRKDDFTYHSILLLTLGLLNINGPVQLLLIFVVYGLVVKQVLKPKHSLYMAIVLVPLFLYFGHVFSLISYKVMLYFDRGVESEGLKFFQVSQTVREAGKIPFETFANRISGSIAGLIVAGVGYIVLVIRHREMILALPLIGIGVFALFGGLRFTVYAVPVAAISAIYLFHVLAMLSDKKAFQIGVPALLGALMLYPNIVHIVGYRIPTVFTQPEVALLDTFRKQTTDKDYVVTWWDYGYPLWFYADKNTLIDGGKHNHDNFIVSEILTTDSQLEAARLSRIAVEHYISSGYQIVADALFHNDSGDAVNVSDYLEQLRYGDVSIPEKSRDVYLYLPYRMLDIFPTVKLFSNLDLNTGAKHPSPFMYATGYFKDTPESIDLGNGVSFLKKQGVLKLGTSQRPLKAFYHIANDSHGNAQVSVQPMHGGQQALSLVYLKEYNRIIIADDAYLNSTYFRLFLFEQYDTSLFEPVLKSPYAKIYRVKI